MDKKNFFSKSMGYETEYGAFIVKIDEVTPIQGTNNLGVTKVLSGCQVIVRRDQVKGGDIMVFCPAETELCPGFLSANNCYCLSEAKRNHCWPDIRGRVEYLHNQRKKATETYQELLEMSHGRPEGNKLAEEYYSFVSEENLRIENELKQEMGFFDKHGRVKEKKIRGIISSGILISESDLSTWRMDFPELTEDLVGTAFDSISGELFVKKYISPRDPNRPIKEFVPAGRTGWRSKLLSRVIPGEFLHHYKTNPLEYCPGELKPRDLVSISVKLHGTSVVIGRVNTRASLIKPITDRIFSPRISDWIVNHLKFLSYRTISGMYSTRRVIQDEFVTESKPQTYYKNDIYAEYYNMLLPYIPAGMTIYGEIVGYLTGTEEYIQTGYDYGCQPGENYMMIYRITTSLSGGKKKEWTLTEVLEWTKALDLPEGIKGRIRPINIIYTGALGDLYPRIVDSENYDSELLTNLQTGFGLESMEPLCIAKVPREGIVIRPEEGEPRAYKVKAKLYRDRERILIDQGIIDREMAQDQE